MSLDLVVKEAVKEAVLEAMRELRSSGQLGTGGGEILEYSEAAALVRYHVSTITRWVRSGLLPAHGRGKGRRVYRADVLRALEFSSKPKEAPTAKSIADSILGGGKVRRIR